MDFNFDHLNISLSPRVLEEQEEVTDGFNIDSIKDVLMKRKAKDDSAILMRKLKKKYRTLIRQLKKLEHWDTLDSLESDSLRKYFLDMYLEEQALSQLGKSIKLTFNVIDEKYQTILKEKVFPVESV